MFHKIPERLLSRKVTVCMIGAGGTGSFMLTGLAQLHLAMLALGHPHGLHVIVIDNDEVSAANVARQMFYFSDIGQSKAAVLVNRLNLTFGTQWEAQHALLTEDSYLNADIVIGCVDNRKARKAILVSAERYAKRQGKYGSVYWLDIGNRLNDGQIIFGEIGNSHHEGELRLPNAADLFPEIIDESLEGSDDTPSCSLAEALEKQSLFINRGVSLYALNLLSEFFRHGQVDYHGVFVNLKSARTSPLAIDAEVWKRFGFEHSKLKRKRQKRK